MIIILKILSNEDVAKLEENDIYWPSGIFLMLSIQCHMSSPKQSKQSKFLRLSYWSIPCVSSPYILISILNLLLGTMHFTSSLLSHSQLNSDHWTDSWCQLRFKGRLVSSCLMSFSSLSSSPLLWCGKIILNCTENLESCTGFQEELGVQTTHQMEDFKSTAW